MIRALPYAGAALAVAAALWWTYDAGRDSRDGEVARLIAERDVAASNAVAMRAAVSRQNALVDAWAVEGQAAKERAAAAVRTAQERGKTLAGVMGRLEAAERASGLQGACAVPDAVREGWSQVR